MKKTLLLLGIVALFGCDNVRLEPRYKLVPRFGEAEQEVRQGTDAAADELAKLQRELEAQLQQLDREIQRLQRSATGKTDEAKAEADRTARELEQKKTDLQRQLEAAGKAGEEALRKIGQAIDDAVKQAQRQ